jgi:hypothetical protein
MMKILLCLLLCYGISCNAQQESEENNKRNHRITLVLSHANILQGVKDGDTKWLSVPAWGIDYDYWLSNNWAIGLHTDIIMESFEVKTDLSSEEETITRTSPIAPAFVGIYKPTKHSSFLIGMGAEFAKEENLVLNRIGYEWGTEIRGDWELGFSACYDFRWNAYDSFLIGIGISKIIRPKRNE